MSGCFCWDLFQKAVTQFRQMQTRFFNSGATRASNSPGIASFVHQHGQVWEATLQTWQSFALPQSGHRFASEFDINHLLCRSAFSHFHFYSLFPAGLLTELLPGWYQQLWSFLPVIIRDPSNNTASQDHFAFHRATSKIDS